MMLSNGAYASSETTGTAAIDTDTGINSSLVQEIDSESVEENYSSPSSDDPVAENYSSPSGEDTENTGMEHSSAPLRKWRYRESWYGACSGELQFSVK